MLGGEELGDIFLSRSKRPVRVLEVAAFVISFKM